MKRYPPSVIALTVFFLMICLPAGSLAGFEPSPFHIIIENRTNQLDPASPFHNQVLFDFTIIFTDVAGTTYNFTRRDTLASGQTLGWLVDLSTSSLPLQFFSFTAKMGAEPSPFLVYAFEPATDPPEDPEIAPNLNLGDGPQVAKEYQLFGFASPGVLVGSVKLANSLCDVTADWKNHGQYVRCVSHAAEDLVNQGLLTQDEADIMVSAAAQSEFGKK